MRWHSFTPSPGTIRSLALSHWSQGIGHRRDTRSTAKTAITYRQVGAFPKDEELSLAYERAALSRPSAARDPASSALSGLQTNSRASVRQPTASPRTAGASSHRTTTPATMLRQFHRNRRAIMSKIKTDDGTEIFFKDWGTGQPIVFHHGWSLSADEWDRRALFE